MLTFSFLVTFGELLLTSVYLNKLDPSSREIISPACPWSASGPPLGGTCPEHFILVRCPNHLKWVLSIWSLLDDQTPHPSHLLEKAHFHPLYPQFGDYAKLLTIGEVRNINWLVNRELLFYVQLSLHHNRLAQRLLISCSLLLSLFKSIPGKWINLN